MLSPLGSISILCIPSDNGTWATTLYAASSDAPMRRLRDPDVFERVVRACPLHAHWLDGEPISEISSMSGVVDRTRRFVVDDVPVVTGLLSIADAHACTNPSIGRGMTVAEIDPWHIATRDLDRARIAAMEAAVEGRDYELGPAEQIGAALLAATRFDEQCARWFGEIQQCLAFPLDVLSREGALDHVLAVTAGVETTPIPGPDRKRLLELVS
jgi:hypothetical protein